MNLKNETVKLERHTHSDMIDIGHLVEIKCTGSLSVAVGLHSETYAPKDNVGLLYLTYIRVWNDCYE